MLKFGDRTAFQYTRSPGAPPPRPRATAAADNKGTVSASPLHPDQPHMPKRTAEDIWRESRQESRLRTAATLAGIAWGMLFLLLP